MVQHAPLNIGLMRAFVWSGVIVVITLILAQGLMMGFVPPPAPSFSADRIAGIFAERKYMILLGAIIQCIFWSFWTTWATVIAVFINRMEHGKAPLLTFTSIATIGGGYVFFILVPMTWATIAFRIETLDPGIVQIMNDWVWFDWLFTWPPFALWMVIIALAVFNDSNAPKVFPRWVAYFNLWCAVGICPAGLIGLFKTGPFAYNGAISFWFAIFVFFGWIVVMTWVAFRAIDAAAREQSGERAAVPASGSRDLQPAAS